MLYSNLTFLLGFFPVLTLLSILDRSAEYKNMLLIIGSVLFISWGRPFYVSIILLFSLFDWLISLLMDKKCKGRNSKKALLISDGLLNLFALLFFTGKIFPAKMSAFASFESVLPLCVTGILLRGFSYTLSVYKGEIPAEKNYFCLLTYTSNLCLVGSGYLPEYKDSEPLIRKRKITPENFSCGLTKMFVGMGKIVILSGAFGLISSSCTEIQSWVVTAFGIFCYFAQYFFLFTGLWDMSQGLGLTFGFDFKKNYKPVSAEKGLSSVVRNFNITLGDFLVKSAKTITEKKFAVVIFCGLCGFLYGKTPEFLCAGFLAGIVILLELTVSGEKLKKIPAFVRGIYTFILVLLIFSLVYFNDFSCWLDFITFKNLSRFTVDSTLKNAVLNNLWLIIFSLFVAVKPLNEFVRKKADRIQTKSTAFYKGVNAVKTVAVGLIFVASVILSL